MSNRRQVTEGRIHDEVREIIKPLFRYMHEKNISLISVAKTGFDANVRIDFETGATVDIDMEDTP